MVKRQPAVQAHKGTPAYRTVDDGDNWHLFWFFGLGMIAMLLPRTRSVPVIILIFSVLNLYSLATELTQEHLIPGRAFQWSDLAMNAVGITAGIGTSLIALHGRYHTKRFMRWTLR